MSISSDASSSGNSQDMSGDHRNNWLIAMHLYKVRIFHLYRLLELYLFLFMKLIGSIKCEHSLTRNRIRA